MTALLLTVASGDELSVRNFSAEEAASTLFSVSIWARSPSAEIDLEAIVGKEATFHVTHGTRHTCGLLIISSRARPNESASAHRVIRCAAARYS